MSGLLHIGPQCITTQDSVSIDRKVQYGPRKLCVLNLIFLNPLPFLPFHTLWLAPYRFVEIIIWCIIFLFVFYRSNSYVLLCKLNTLFTPTASIQHCYCGFFQHTSSHLFYFSQISTSNLIKKVIWILMVKRSQHNIFH